jgi:hypothetical protein
MEDYAPLFVPFTEAEHSTFLSTLEKIGPTGDLTVSSSFMCTATEMRDSQGLRGHIPQLELAPTYFDSCVSPRVANGVHSLPQLAVQRKTFGHMPTDTCCSCRYTSFG